MKIETRERQKVEEYKVYVANDGEVFFDEDKCREYEKSIDCIVAVRFKSFAKKIVKGYSAIDEIVEDGYANGDYYLVTPNDDSELNTMLAFFSRRGGELSEKTRDCMFLGLDRIKVGGTYIIDDHDGWAGIVSYESVKERIEKNMATLAKVFDGTIEKEEN